MIGILGYGGPTASATAVYVPTKGVANELDCNGGSPLYPVLKVGVCTDIRGLGSVNTEDGRFYDNGVYIGHDEPDMTFLSDQPGSGNDVSWTETLPTDPAALPTVSTPGNDITHWFELTIAPWFSMDLCNGESFPQLPCTPQSDANAPACIGVSCPANAYPGAGNSFLEMQFYPPGDGPFADSVSCDNDHWCASLHINDLECSFTTCNPNCIEPTNFAFVQMNGQPTGPPNPQTSTVATFTPNRHTLLMNPGDNLAIHIGDAPAPGGGNALKVSIDDLSTGQFGFMQASAANGFAQTSIKDCSGTPFNYEPEYSTAKAGNISPWTALQTNISTQFEIGHGEACTAVTNQLAPPFSFGAGGPSDPIYGTCMGPYESRADTGKNPEVSDALCYPNGDTHGTLNSQPNEVALCEQNLFQNGDLDFDGSSYYPDWPTGNSAGRFPSTFVQSLPSSAGRQYSQFFFQTDVALSESACTPKAMSDCTVPPPSPGNFYPFWSEKATNGTCTIEFGNVTSGVNSFSGVAQYGSNQFPTLGFPEFVGQPINNTCPAG